MIKAVSKYQLSNNMMAGVLTRWRDKVPVNVTCLDRRGTIYNILLVYGFSISKRTYWTKVIQSYTDTDARDNCRLKYTQVLSQQICLHGLHTTSMSERAKIPRFLSCIWFSANTINSKEGLVFLHQSITVYMWVCLTTTICRGPKAACRLRLLMQRATLTIYQTRPQRNF